MYDEEEFEDVRSFDQDYHGTQEFFINKTRSALYTLPVFVCDRKQITPCLTLTTERSLEVTAMIIWMKLFTEAGDRSVPHSSGK